MVKQVHIAFASLCEFIFSYPMPLQIMPCARPTQAAKTAKKGIYYVSQCLNIDVSSFGDTVDGAIEALREAVTLYFEDDNDSEYHEIGVTLLGMM